MRVSKIDDAIAKGNRYGVGAVEGTKLLNRGADMLVDSSLGDMQNFTDLPGRLAFRHPPKNLDLARTEDSFCLWSVQC